jgi:DNA-3-methyladenine glycosylase I
MERTRCPWARDIPEYFDYHDNEWGRPEHNDVKLFEMLILEGMQAGLSWLTVLRKRDAFREAFDDFDPEKVALYDTAKIEDLMSDKRIIRNRLKIRAAVGNAAAFLRIAEEYGSFDNMIWAYVDHRPIVGRWKDVNDIPLTIPIADKIGKDLKKRGFNFVGPTIIYSFMQAVGMVNDHTADCFVHEDMTKG